MLEYVPSHFKVIRHVRPKLNCQIPKHHRSESTRTAYRAAYMRRALGTHTNLEVQQQSAALSTVQSLRTCRRGSPMLDGRPIRSDAAVLPNAASQHIDTDMPLTAEKLHV